MNDHPHIMKLCKILSVCSFAMMPVIGSAITFQQKTVTVQLMDWRYDDIAKECTEYLGPHGFKAVQISAPNEHANVPNFAGQVHPWFERYGAVSYKIHSRSGTREELAKMVKTCADAGIEVYADAVINHMASTVPEGGTHHGYAGSAYTFYNHPDAGYSFDDFHHFEDGGCNQPDNNFNEDYSDVVAVRKCRLWGLSDLKTEKESVRNTIAAYLKDLMSLGIKGFRIDAAKHMHQDDLKAILQKAGGSPFVMPEVIGWKDQPVNNWLYLDLGAAQEAITADAFGNNLSSLFLSGQAWKLNEWGDTPIGENWGMIPSDKALIFIDNHDSQRDDADRLTYKNGDLYKVANVFMLGYPYGHVRLMSSFYFEDRNWGTPHNSDGTISRIHQPDGSVDCTDHSWICEHRWPEISRMVPFRNLLADATTLNNWWSNKGGQVAYGRGHKGFVVVNTESVTMDTWLQTGLPAGRYCDVVNSNYNYDNGNCTDDVVRVGNWIDVGSDGMAHFVLPPVSASAIFVYAKEFFSDVNAVRMAGDFVDWDPANDEYELARQGQSGNWEGVFQFPAGPISFKFTYDGSWARNFGDNDEVDQFPVNGSAQSGNNVTNINLTIPHAGMYRVTYNESTLQYSIAFSGDNVPPTANAGKDLTVQVGEFFILDGSLSLDPDGTIESYDWGDGLSGAMVQHVLNEPGEHVFTLTVTDDKGAQDTDEVKVKVRNGGEDWQRTVVFIFGQTISGQDMFVRGGIDYDYAKANLGLDCKADPDLCKIPIRHLNLFNKTTAPWKQGDTMLDWGGKESGQGSGAHGSPLDWTTNVWPSSWGTKRVYEQDGYGETPLNQWGQHYWLLEVEMDCAATVDGWFELKAYISNGPGWERDINQSGTPYASRNHFAQCGKINVFKHSSNSVIIQDF